jgi:hypothetical protein
MRFVQPAPARPYIGLVSQLSCARRTTEIHKGRIRTVSKVKQLGVDSLTLPPPHRPRRTLSPARAFPNTP